MGRDSNIPILPSSGSEFQPQDRMLSLPAGFQKAASVLPATKQESLRPDLSGSDHCPCMPPLEIHIAVTSSSFQTRHPGVSFTQSEQHKPCPCCLPTVHTITAQCHCLFGGLCHLWNEPRNTSPSLAPSWDGWRCLRGAGDNRATLHECNAGPDLPPPTGPRLRSPRSPQGHILSPPYGPSLGSGSAGTPRTPQLPSNSQGRAGLGESSPPCHSLACHLVGPTPEALPNGRDSHSPG